MNRSSGAPCTQQCKQQKHTDFGEHTAIAVVSKNWYDYVSYCCVVPSRGVYVCHCTATSHQPKLQKNITKQRKAAPRRSHRVRQRCLPPRTHVGEHRASHCRPRAYGFALLGVGAGRSDEEQRGYHKKGIPF